MRISTNTLYNSGTARLAELTAEISRTQQQIASGKRILTPSDDPVDAVRSLQMTQAKEAIAQFTVNRNNVDSSLSQVEGVLGGATSLLQNIKEKILSANSGVMSDTERRYIASELRGTLDDLIGLANAKDGEGNYLFSGFKTNVAPYQKTPAGADYMGDMGERMVQIDTGRQMALSQPGPDVFKAGATDIFSSVTDLIELLETPGLDSTTRTAGLNTANTQVTAILDNVLTVRALNGARMQELDTLNEVGKTMDFEYSDTLKDLQGVDYFEAISNLSQQQFVLQAAQKTFVTMSGMSLFDLIK